MLSLNRLRRTFFTTAILRNRGAVLSAGVVCNKSLPAGWFLTSFRTPWFADKKLNGFVKWRFIKGSEVCKRGTFLCSEHDFH
jgi:hypothetical protein